MMTRHLFATFVGLFGGIVLSQNPAFGETRIAGFTLPIHIPGLPSITVPIEIPGVNGALPKPVFAVSQSGRNCPAVPPTVSVKDGLVSVVYPKGTQFGTSGEVACIVGLTYQAPERAQLAVTAASFSGTALTQGVVTVAGGITGDQHQKPVFSSVLPVVANSGFSAESLSPAVTDAACMSGMQTLQIVVGASGPVQLDSLRVKAGFVRCQ